MTLVLTVRHKEGVFIQVRDSICYIIDFNNVKPVSRLSYNVNVTCLKPGRPNGHLSRKIWVLANWPFFSLYRVIALTSSRRVVEKSCQRKSCSDCYFKHKFTIHYTSVINLNLLWAATKTQPTANQENGQRASEFLILANWPLAIFSLVYSRRVVERNWHKICCSNCSFKHNFTTYYTPVCNLDLLWAATKNDHLLRKISIGRWPPDTKTIYLNKYRS